MAERYLIDTCVWRDYLEERTGPGGRPLGRYAAKLFEKIIKEGSTIVFSISLIWELKKDYPMQNIESTLLILDTAVKLE